MNENLSQMLVIAVMGIFMVFAVLSILWAVIEIMHFLIGLAEKKKNKKVAPATPAPAKAEITNDEDEDELIAVLTAAVAASLNTSTYNLRIKSFRRIGQNSPAWNTVSRKEQLESNL